MKLKLDLTLEPIEIETIDKNGFTKEYPIEDGMYCKESIPVGSGNNKYILSIFTDVSQLKDVFNSHNKLTQVMDDLAQVWPIATGYRLGHLQKKQTEEVRYDSNLDLVLTELQKKEKVKIMTSSLNQYYSIWHGFLTPPLEVTLILRDNIRKDPELRKLIGYYYEAIESKEKWFIALYKIKDQLNSIHNNRAKNILSIKNEYWQFFELKLNSHDLRHPGKKDKNMPIDNCDRNELFKIARSWIAKEMEQRNIPYSEKGIEKYLD